MRDPRPKFRVSLRRLLRFNEIRTLRFQNATGQFTCHGRKTFKKFVERVIVFQILEQRLHRHARAFEHRRAAENVGINSDEVVRLHAGNLPHFAVGRKSLNSGNGFEPQLVVIAEKETEQVGLCSGSVLIRNFLSHQAILKWLSTNTSYHRIWKSEQNPFFANNAQKCLRKTEQKAQNTCEYRLWRTCH